MKFGLVLPNTGGCGDPRLLADIAHEAEEEGWDGIFLFDCVQSNDWDTFFKDVPEKRGYADPWIALSAMAMRTREIRLGTMVTPVTRRRPWKLARETVSLDLLSGGRLILLVGLGATDDGGFARVNEETDRRTRAQRLDEGLTILDGLWRGEPLTFRGEHFVVEDLCFLPRPVQSPRIPIWVVGLWPFEKSMQRAARWDGVIPAARSADGSPANIDPSAVTEIRAYLEKHHAGDTPADIVIEGESPGSDPDKAAAIVRPFQEAGATWWLESAWMRVLKPPPRVERMRQRIRRGPPRVS